MVEPVFVLPIVANDCLKQLIYFTEVVVCGRSRDSFLEGLTPLGRERSSITSK
jgi:hypothetical protein